MAYWGKKQSGRKNEEPAKEIEPSPAAQSVAQAKGPTKSKPKRVGFNIAAFAADTLAPSDQLEDRLSLTDIWAAYKTWCHSSEAAPIAYVLFIDKFDEIASAVGMRYYQRGSNRLYLHVTLRSAP